MLQHTIYILEKVSLDVRLFSKELQKAIGLLTSADIVKLKEWFNLFTANKQELRVFESYFAKI